MKAVHHKRWSWIETHIQVDKDFDIRWALVNNVADDPSKRSSAQCGLADFVGVGDWTCAVRALFGP